MEFKFDATIRKIVEVSFVIFFIYYLIYPQPWEANILPYFNPIPLFCHKKKQNTPAQSSTQKKSSGKIDTRFLENVVGGKGDNAKHVEKNDGEQLLANVDIDDVQGGSGDDVLKGSSDDDKLKGGQGDDKLKGGSGASLTSNYPMGKQSQGSRVEKFLEKCHSSKRKRLTHTSWQLINQASFQ